MPSASCRPRHPRRALGFTANAAHTPLPQIGRKDGKDKEAEAARLEKYPNLSEPHRLRALMGKKIKVVASGPSACHSIVIGEGLPQASRWGSRGARACDRSLGPYVVPRRQPGQGLFVGP